MQPLCLLLRPQILLLPIAGRPREHRLPFSRKGMCPNPSPSLAATAPSVLNLVVHLSKLVLFVKKKSPAPSFFSRPSDSRAAHHKRKRFVRRKGTRRSLFSGDPVRRQERIGQAMRPVGVFGHTGSTDAIRPLPLHEENRTKLRFRKPCGRPAASKSGRTKRLPGVMELLPAAVNFSLLQTTIVLILVARFRERDRFTEQATICRQHPIRCSTTIYRRCFSEVSSCRFRRNLSRSDRFS